MVRRASHRRSNCKHGEDCYHLESPRLFSPLRGLTLRRYIVWPGSALGSILPHNIQSFMFCQRRTAQVFVLGIAPERPFFLIITVTERQVSTNLT
ncbi:hypothetical protein OG21DRAFT_752601 [Imleria badia]|nr:hypothetical protein OG21DRAFT_752601 [Imleria badia]